MMYRVNHGLGRITTKNDITTLNSEIAAAVIYCSRVCPSRCRICMVDFPLPEMDRALQKPGFAEYKWKAWKCILLSWSWQLVHRLQANYGETIKYSSTPLGTCQLVVFVGECRRMDELKGCCAWVLRVNKLIAFHYPLHASLNLSGGNGAWSTSIHDERHAGKQWHHICHLYQCHCCMLWIC